jgi:glycosyltransferase involved in cell wall biosynthesis
MFNYILPVFNKQDVLPLTLAGIDRCASINAKIYIIIDGCTDRSEEIVDEFISRTGRNVIKLHMPNVHMLRSVNAAFKLVESGYTIISQDDIIIEDELLEQKIEALYAKMGPRLGVVSLRLGANVAPTSILRRIKQKTFRGMISEYGYIRSNDDHYNCENTADYGQFYCRATAINGPNVVPWALREKIGILDEELAPYGFDDPEYCLRAMKAGFINGVFPIKYRSDVEWGGTRRSKDFMRQVARIHRRNRIRIWQKHGTFIDSINSLKAVFNETRPIDSLDDIDKAISLVR